MNKIIKRFLGGILLSIVFVLVAAPKVYAEGTPIVSITFDDGFVSTYTNALPVLSVRNLPATVFITTGLVGENEYMTWDQILDLQNTYGWEIGNHTVTHAELPLLTLPQITDEINGAYNALISHGLNVTSFASPFGAYDSRVLQEALKYHSLHRGFFDSDDLNSYPYQRGIIMVKSVETAVTVDQVKAWVDQATNENKWLVLVFHEIQPNFDPDYEYTNTVEQLGQIADYIVEKGIAVKNLNHTLVKNGENLVINPSFEEGLSGWTTDNSSQVTYDSNTNGSYPSPKDSVLFTGNGLTPAHIFSSLVPNTFTSYILEAFVNARELTSGELGYYIDEYDDSGNWISGQWLGLIAPGDVKYFTKNYIPSSQYVKNFAIQTYLTLSSLGKAFVDNYDIRGDEPSPTTSPSPSETPVSTATPSPTASPTPTPSPAPTGTNLVENYSFEVLDADGWATSWQKNSQDWSINTASAGNDGTNSASLVGGVGSAHLFSSLISINPTASYVWNQYLSVGAVIGEFGFYIDEYDANNNWISGKWLGVIPSSFVGNKQISYSPTSSNVQKIRLQYYKTLGTNLNLNLDSVTLTGPTPTPSPSPTPTATATATPTATPTPAEVNLVPNPGFELATSGWATDWERTNTDWTLDTGSHGNEGINSAHLISGSGNSHLFSPLLTVDTTVNYLWRQYISVGAITGEFGFYIDEYDINGNWISGKWLGMIPANFAGTKEINYTPTSSNVNKIRLQYYKTVGTNLDLFLDSVLFTKAS